VAGNHPQKAEETPLGPRTIIRRKDCKIVEQERIGALLGNGVICFIATTADDQPYVHPHPYRHYSKNKRIHFHTAIKCRTRTNIERNQNVCVGIAKIGSLLPVDIALEFSAEYASVSVYEKCKILESEAGLPLAPQGLLDIHVPARKPDMEDRGFAHEELERTSDFATEIESRSGQEKSASR
jgi:nitroimidazol reductase NimA-like FMN-containing flavoprotein (pyridoxamine 5'-phosphate oxidase superfamily)